MVMTKEDKREYDKQYNVIHREDKRIKAHNNYLKNRDKILLKTNEYNHSHKEQTANNQSKWGLELKTRIITHYGNGKCACVKCGFNDIRALVLDHINGNGAKHRESVKKLGMRFYLWLEKNNYPDGFQTLCSNCNLIKMIDNKEYRLMNND